MTLVKQIKSTSPALTIIAYLVFALNFGLHAEEKISPWSLKNKVLEQNLSLQQTVMRVRQADDKVMKARLDLLPSINVAAALSGPSGFGMQAMATLPFLLPSNWFQLSAKTELLSAELAGLRSLQLNTLLSAERNYFLLLRDQDFLVFLQIYRDELEKIRQIYEHRMEKSREIDLVGSNYINGKIFSSRSVIEKTIELLKIEKASFNRIIKERDDFNLFHIDLSAGPLDNYTTTQLLDFLVHQTPMSPEMEQLNWLLEAAKSTKWTNVFGFLNSAGISSSSSSGFSQMSGTGTINLGFGIIPLISLGDHQISEIELQKQDLAEEGWRLIQNIEASLSASKNQITDLESAVASYEESHRLSVERLRRGANDYILPINTLQLALDAKTQLLDAKLNLNFARLQLDRLMRKGLFEYTPKPKI